MRYDVFVARDGQWEYQEAVLLPSLNHWPIVQTTLEAVGLYVGRGQDVVAEDRCAHCDAVGLLVSDAGGAPLVSVLPNEAHVHEWTSGRADDETRSP